MNSSFIFFWDFRLEMIFFECDNTIGNYAERGKTLVKRQLIATTYIDHYARPHARWKSGTEAVRRLFVVEKMFLVLLIDDEAY